MNIHERARTTIQQYADRTQRLIDALPPSAPSRRTFVEDIESLEYALKILEAVKNIEEWMVEHLNDRLPVDWYKQHHSNYITARYIMTQEVVKICQAILNAKKK